MLRKTRNWVFIMALPLIAACGTTPDLKPWADATASLNAAVGVENEAIVNRMTEAKARINAWNPNSSRVKEIQSEVEIYRANAKQIEAILDLAVNYSNSLTQLAEAGETGEKAASNIMGTLKKGAGILDIAIPAAGVGVDIASRAFTAVAATYTRIEAQKSLAIAMEAAETGNPNPSKFKVNGTEKDIPATGEGFVPVLAEELTNLYKAGDKQGKGAGAQRIIISGLWAQEDGIDLDIAGSERIGFYRYMNATPTKILEKEATRLDHYFADLNDKIGSQDPIRGICAKPRGKEKDPNCLVGQTAQSLDSIIALIIATEKNSQEFADRQAENAKFARQRYAAAASMVKAVKVWREEHKRIADELKRCGGWKSATDLTCGAYNFSNLKAAVEKLKAIAGKGDN